MIKDAKLSKDRNYRYVLKRQWGNDNGNFINFILLNPSTADETVDDPTVKACIAFAKNLKYEGLCITNLFAYRTKNPKVLKNCKEPIGEQNNRYILDFATKSKQVIIAWGNHGNYKNRNSEVLLLLAKIKVPHCLGVTKVGNPKHPLYIPRSTKPFRYLSNI